ncbi:MAG: hypothetical protein QNJ42_23480 [Crocosphaera sp.]|nr:hypothetical protein [Crocosphaera sp.]
MSKKKNAGFGSQVYGGSISVQTGGGAVVGSAIGGMNSTIDNQNIQVSQYPNEKKQTLAEAAEEIRQLLLQLEKSYSIDTASGQMMVAAEAVKTIETNPSLKQKVIAALKAGGLEAFEKAINHPVSAFIVGAIKSWQEAK